MLRFFNDIHRRTKETLIQNIELPFLNQLTVYGCVGLSVNFLLNIMVGLDLHKDNTDEISSVRAAACFGFAVYAGFISGIELSRRSNEALGYRFN